MSDVFSRLLQRAESEAHPPPAERGDHRQARVREQQQRSVDRHAAWLEVIADADGRLDRMGDEAHHLWILDYYANY